MNHRDQGPLLKQPSPDEEDDNEDDGLSVDLEAGRLDGIREIDEEWAQEMQPLELVKKQRTLARIREKAQARAAMLRQQEYYDEEEQEYYEEED